MLRTHPGIENYKARRASLIAAIKKEHASNHGTIVLFAGFETDAAEFRQESSFFYYTGISEPGTIVTVDLDGTAILHVPCQTQARALWVDTPMPLVPDNAQVLGFDAIDVLGKECSGYQFGPYTGQPHYEKFLARLSELISGKSPLFVLDPDNAYQYPEQRFILARLLSFLGQSEQRLIDISQLVARARQHKDSQEVECLYAAVDITIWAHEAAATMIRAESPELLEYDIQAALEFVMTSTGSKRSFPSIVASGKNGTILHYTANNAPLKKGDLVIVDIGAEYEHYCGDLTRTYPVSRSFTKRQKEIYSVVLDTQTYIADLAKPGYWLNNPKEQNKSLQHLAKAYLKKYGYDEYFIHGIGHHLGLDVHDAGDPHQPLHENAIITIEPGIYIKSEGIGIRIEDNYWIVKEGAVCLSEKLPKHTDDLIEFMETGIDESLYEDFSEIDNQDD